MRLTREKKQFGKACLSMLVSLCLALSVCLGPAATALPAFAADGSSFGSSSQPVSAEEAEQRAIEEVEQSIGPEESYVSDEILVRYENGDIQTLDVDQDESVAEAIVEAEADPQIEMAQPNYIYTLVDDDASPSVEASDASGSNDSIELSGSVATAIATAATTELSAWHLKTIRAQEAWTLLPNNGSSQVTVAIIDSGCDLNHSALQDALWKDHAWDVTTDDYLKKSSYTDAEGAGGHGTHVTGIIAGAVSESQSTAGVYPEAKVLPIKVIGETKKTTTQVMIEAVRKAVEHRGDLNVRVINMSLAVFDSNNNPVFDQAFDDEITAAAKQGVVPVAAAGNSGTRENYYPASSEKCISVTACNRYGKPYSGSTYGSKTDICSPGDSIVSTLPGSTYGLKTGTSMASPVVAATAAMVIALHPEYGFREAKMAILASAAQKELYASEECRSGAYGVGVVDAYGAVAHEAIAVVPPEESDPATPSNRIVPIFRYQVIKKTDGARAFTNSFSTKSGVLYSSSNAKVLRVSSTGKVSIVGPGIAYVRAKVTNASFVPGTYSYMVKVKPKTTVLTTKTKSLSTGRIRVAWKAGTATISGYQIKYRRIGAKSWTYKTVKGQSVIKTTTKKLKRSKSYYVKIRTYKVSMSQKLYSAWSSAKKVKVAA